MQLSLQRIIAIILRHIRPTLRDPIRYMDMFYWPFLDICLWGFTTVWLKQNVVSDSNAIAMLLTSLVLWQIVFRSSIEVTRNLLEELWHQNLINLFATPLKISEWIIGIMSLSFAHACWNMIFGATMVYLIFDVNVFGIGISFIPLALMGIVFGWILGFLASSLILKLGRHAEMLAWSLPWFFSAFSAVFYPVSVLPGWIQNFSWALSGTYIFESTRYAVQTGLLKYDYIGCGILLNVVYLAAVIILFIASFKRAKVRGLTTLE